MSLIELRLENYALLRRASLELGDGLNVLTGESGSGKSLSMEALRWCLGGRTSAAVAPDGTSSRTMVAATFQDVPERAARMAADFGIPENDGLVTLVRHGPPGKVNARINGAVVSGRTLTAIASELVEITSQGESGRLTQSGYQRDLLDWFSGTAGIKHQVAELFAQKTRLEQTIAQTGIQRSMEAELRAEAVAVQRQLAGLQLREEQQEQLRAELAELSAASRTRMAAEQVRKALGGADEQPGARDLIAAMLPMLHQLPKGQSVISLISTIDSLLMQMDAAAREARSMAERATENPGRLAEVEEELSRMATAIRRFGSLAAAQDEQKKAELLLSDTESSPDVSTLRHQLQEVTDELAVRALELHAIRATAAADLQQQVTALLCELGIPEAQFVVDCTLREAPSGIPVDGKLIAVAADGADQVQLLFSSAHELQPMPLAAVASGGELSRVALALRVLISAEADSPTLVLDEVDTGIGGQTAIRMGEVLCTLGKSRQIITITHRAEIAARALGHLVVRRQVTSAGTESTIHPLDGDERVLEIARLLSGSPTAAARQRAMELLDNQPSSGSQRHVAAGGVV